MKKLLWILGVGLAVLILGVLIMGVFYLGPLVKIGIEKAGPEVTQVSVKVDGVDISPLSGSARIKGLTVGNPAGYTTPQAINVGTIAVSLDPGSIMSDKIVIHSILVESPEITFEGGLSKNNLNKILDNMSGSPASASTEANTTAQTNSKPAPKIVVEDFLITGAKVHVDLSNLISKDISIPDIHLTNLGQGGKGFTPIELSRVILEAIITTTVKGVTGSLSSLGLGVKDLGQGAVKTATDGLSKLTGSFGGLLGK